MIKFMKGCQKLRLHWQAWLGVLLTVNMILPLWFLHEPVAIITLVGTMSGAIVGMILTEAFGFTKILGLMHGPWVPMFVLQLIVIVKQNPQGNFKNWLYLSAALTFISLVIDTFDVIAYLKGNRKDLLA